MEITRAAERLDNLSQILTRIADGQFDESVPVSDHHDLLTPLEMGINFMIMDLRAMAKSNAEKEAELVSQQAELKARLKTIEEQNAAIRELSTPVMEIWDDILVLPVVGVVDTHRSMEIMNTLLQRIVDGQAKCVIIDITGVEVVDTKTADYLLRVARAARLLGTRCVLTGLSPAVAQTLVEIGADITEITTLRNLKEGLKDCLAYIRRNVKGAVAAGA